MHEVQSVSYPPIVGYATGHPPLPILSYHFARISGNGGATSDQGAALAMSGAVRTLVAPAHGCSLSAPTTPTRGWAGETALVELRLTNEGLVSDTYILSADGGPWVATLSMGRLELAPGESASPVLRVVVPAGAAEGETGVYTIRAVSAAGMDAEARSVAVVSGIVQGRIWVPALLRR